MGKRCTMHFIIIFFIWNIWNMQILFANKVVNAGVIEIPFLWGSINANIYGSLERFPLQ